MTGRDADPSPRSIVRALTARIAPLSTALLLSAVIAPCGAAQSIRASCQPDQVFVGDRVRYEVVVEQASQVGDPSSLEIEGANVSFLGRNQQSFTTLRNGRLESTSSISFTYDVMPTRIGNFEITSPTVQADGRSLRAGPVRFEVREPEKQDLVVPVLTADPRRSYLFQPFVVELRVFVRKLPGDGRDSLDPLSVLQDPPRMQIDWADDREALEAPSKSDWLTPKMARARRGESRRGFSINGLETQGDPFDLFDLPFGSRMDRRAVFDLGGRPARAEDVRGVEGIEERWQDYWVYTLERSYRPVRTGRQTFGPATVRGLFADRENARGLQGKEIYAVSSSVTVDIEPAPLEGRPESFTGGVGQYQVSADVQPRSLHVGDPLTFSLRVSGTGNLDEIGPPSVESDPRFTQAFRVYEPTSSTQNGSRVFTWSLRPVSAGSLLVPAVAFSYFDFEKERYSTVETRPLTVEVEEGARLDLSEIVSAEQGPSRVRDLTANQEGIFAPIIDRSRLVQERVHLSRTLVLLGGIAVSGPLLAAVVGWLRRRKSDPAAIRRKMALARSRQRLEGLRAARHTGDRSAAVQHARACVAALVTAALEGDENASTAGDLALRLQNAGFSEEASRTRELLDHWDALQFGAYGPDLSALTEQTEQWLDDLRRRLQRGGLL